MNLLCSKDELRHVLNCIYFDEGNAIATDGSAILVVPLYEISTLDIEDSGKLEGKLINKDDYRELLKFELIRVENDGVVGISRKTGAETKYLFKDYRYPDYKSMMGSCRKCPQTQTVTFMGSHAAIMCEIMNTPFVTLEPNGTGAIGVTFKDSKAKGLIVSCPEH